MNFKTVKAFGEKIAALSPDGAMLAVGFVTYGTVDVYEIGETPTKVLTRTAADGIRQIAWSRDSKKVAVLSGRGDILLFSVESGTADAWQGQMFDCHSIAFMPEGELIVALSSGDIMALDFSQGLPVSYTLLRASVTGRGQGAILNVDTDPDGRINYLIYRPHCYLEVCRIFPMRDGQFRTFSILDMSNDTRIHTYAHRNGTTAAILTDGGVYLWRGGIPRKLTAVEAQSIHRRHFVAISGDASILIWASQDGAAFWDAKYQIAVGHLYGHNIPEGLSAIHCAQRSPYCALIGRLEVAIVRLPVDGRNPDALTVEASELGRRVRYTPGAEYNV